MPPWDHHFESSEALNTLEWYPCFPSSRLFLYTIAWISGSLYHPQVSPSAPDTKMDRGKVMGPCAPPFMRPRGWPQMGTTRNKILHYLRLHVTFDQRRCRRHQTQFGARHLVQTLTTPSPPPLTTHRPSALHCTAHTPSPRMGRCDAISCTHERFSSDQKRRLASWPAETSSRPSGESERAEMAAGCASMV